VALLVVGLPADSDRVIEARLVALAPKIDGVLDEVWQTADSACSFTQLTPDYDSASAEQTTAYVLYDNRNLYVAFRCRARDATAVRARMTGTNDGIRLFLDTFDDKTSAYSFSVGAGGVETTYRLTNDGAWMEDWSGVWQSRARVEPWGFAVELAIPFKTLRFPPGSTCWGIEFGRYIVDRGEKSYWSKHEKSGFKVSKIGRLEGLKLPSAGLHIEAYPVGLVRYEMTGGQRPEAALEPAAGLDAAWLPTPTANIQLTTLPDFAQIEADPYQVNLSKYELYLDERRPFFVEAAENFGSGYEYVRMFYSRRIGKRLYDGTEVPILGGAKYTDRIGRFQFGALGAVTGRTSYFAGADTEPVSVYSVASVRRQVLGNSEVGVLYAGKDNARFSNHGVRLDGVYRRGSFTAKACGAGSQLGGSLDHALSAQALYQGSAYSGGLTLRQTAPKFDMNGIGYTGWRGQSVNAYAGPDWYSTALFQSFSLQASGSVEREWDYEGAPDWGASLMAYGRMRNLMYGSLWAGRYTGRYLDTAWNRYSGLNAGWSVGTDPGKSASASSWADFNTGTYNYNRLVLAPSGQGGLWFSFQFGDHVSLDLGNDFVAELEEDGRLDFEKDLTLMFRPSVSMAFTPKMDLAIGNETVRSYDLERERQDYSYYFSLLYSWTLRPRSTLYIALNQRLAGGDNWLESTGTIAVMKLKYLFVF
jgi:hypothetical protein